MTIFNRYFAEEIVLLSSILKWTFLACLTGIIVGCSTSFFIFSLEFVTELVAGLNAGYLLLPFGLFASFLIIHKFAIDINPRGTEKVIRFIHFVDKDIPARSAFIEYITSIITLAVGGSSGKEGPSAMIGSVLSDKFSKLFNLSDFDRKKVVVCGASAAFSGVLGTPIAGALFGVEALFVGKLRYDFLLPALIAGMIGYEVCSFFGVTHSYYNVQTFDFSALVFLKVLLIGILFGLIATFIVYTFKFADKQLKRFHEKKLTPFVATLLLILIFQFSPESSGLGTEVLDSILAGNSIVWYFFIAKILATAITINAAGGGGIITPCLLIGASAGSLFAGIFNLDPTFLASVGLVAILAGVTNTPIACMVLSLELFGDDIVPYATLACIICFLMTGHRSIFPSQIIETEKSHSLVPNDGSTAGQESFKFNIRSRRKLAKFKSFFKFFKKK